LNREGITLVGDVYIEGELVMEEVEGVSLFDTQPNEARPLDMLDAEFS
ncbi:type VI secretion system tip protein VgrG, partial [Aggregatibacter actinomycetemcomitans]|nr:type VI secretion system tip protein VgrG [Aggregatibacter actinomycetemcomitans]